MDCDSYKFTCCVYRETSCLLGKRNCVRLVRMSDYGGSRKNLIVSQVVKQLNIQLNKSDKKFSQDLSIGYYICNALLIGVAFSDVG